MGIWRFFSIIGHPLLLGSGYVFLMSFRKLEATLAWKVSMITLGLITLPVIIHNVIRMKKGDYSNFDVSNRLQRKSFYPFILLLFLLLIGLSYWMKFPQEVIKQTLIIGLMLGILAFINLKIKASLHAALVFFIALIMGMEFPTWQWPFFLFASIVAYSRLKTQKHSLPELLIGGIIGVLAGIFIDIG